MEILCDCRDCVEYAFSHTRVLDISRAQEMAFIEAGNREVERILNEMS